MGAQQRWDAIVVGSGLGGLTTAAHLATNGLRTLVLEQHDTAGGSSQVFRRRRRYEFDVGLHYVGDCGPRGMIPSVFRGLGLEGRVQWRELDPDGFDTIVLPGLSFRVPRGWDRYLERLTETFPAEQAPLRECVAILSSIPRELRAAPPATAENLAELVQAAPTLMRWGLRTMGELLDELGLSPQARAVICAESGDHATPPSRCAVSVHAGLLDHYISGGAWYPAGGGQVLAAHLVEVIHAHDGRVRTQARVGRILTEDGAVRGVELSDGERLEAAVVVSGADLKRTFLELLDAGAVSAATRERVAAARMAPPLFSVYLAVDCAIETLMPNTQFWALPSTDPEAAYRQCAATSPEELELDPAKLFVYITSASWKDRGNPHIAPPGQSTLEIMSLAPGDHRAWGTRGDPVSGDRYGRSESYREVKERFAQALIDRAQELIPGLRDHIVWQEASSPLTQERYTLCTGGGSYGLEFTPDQIGPNRPDAVTEIGGLYLAGASTVWGHGIAGVIRGGVHAASAILHRDLMAEIRAGAVFGEPSRLAEPGPDWDPWLACRRLADKSRRRERALAGAAPAGR